MNKPDYATAMVTLRLCDGTVVTVRAARAGVFLGLDGKPIDGEIADAACRREGIVLARTEVKGRC